VKLDPIYNITHPFCSTAESFNRIINVMCFYKKKKKKKKRTWDTPIQAQMKVLVALKIRQLKHL